jgi:hypothetical protein
MLDELSHDGVLFGLGEDRCREVGGFVGSWCQFRHRFFSVSSLARPSEDLFRVSCSEAVEELPLAG